jgi:dimethylamine monooxygenase subunit DmmA-like protein
MAGVEAHVGGREQSGNSLEWTSVPRWRPPRRLPGAASYLACSFGDEGRSRVTTLLSGADPLTPVRTAAFGTRWDTQTEAALRQLLENCCTGVRIVLAGPEAVVMRAVALARERGASAEEIVPVADEAGDDGYVRQSAARSVFCASCQHVFDAVAAIGGVATCPGCGRDLIVDHRFSRPRAAYFGWPTSLADA